MWVCAPSGRAKIKLGYRKYPNGWTAAFGEICFRSWKCRGAIEAPSEKNYKLHLMKSQCDEFIRPLPSRIRNKWQSWPQDLSGGQMQRLSIAPGAICRKRMFGLLDEPMFCLDKRNRASGIETLDTYQKGKTFWIVSHDTHPIGGQTNLGAVTKEGFAWGIRVKKNLDGLSLKKLLLATLGLVIPRYFGRGCQPLGRLAYWAFLLVYSAAG